MGYAECFAVRNVLHILTWLYCLSDISMSDTEKFARVTWLYFNSFLCMVLYRLCCGEFRVN